MAASLEWLRSPPRGRREFRRYSNHEIQGGNRSRLLPPIDSVPPRYRAGLGRDDTTATRQPRFTTHAVSLSITFLLRFLESLHPITPDSRIRGVTGPCTHDPGDRMRKLVLQFVALNITAMQGLEEMNELMRRGGQESLLRQEENLRIENSSVRWMSWTIDQPGPELNHQHPRYRCIWLRLSKRLTVNFILGCDKDAPCIQMIGALPSFTMYPPYLPCLFSITQPESVSSLSDVPDYGIQNGPPFRQPVGSCAITRDTRLSFSTAFREDQTAASISTMSECIRLTSSICIFADVLFSGAFVTRFLDRHLERARCSRMGL